MAGTTKDQLKIDKKVVKAWTERVVQNPLVDRRDDQHWESLWHGFVLGYGHPELATYTHYLRLGFPVAMVRPAAVAQSPEQS
jgi:hypothetical protein